MNDGNYECLGEHPRKLLFLILPISGSARKIRDKKFVSTTFFQKIQTEAHSFELGMTTSELPGELKEWIVKLMRVDLDRMAGAGIQSDLMNSKQSLYKQVANERTRITIVESQ